MRWIRIAGSTLTVYDATSTRGPRRLLEPFDAETASRSPAAREAKNRAIMALLGLAPATGDDM